MANMQRLHYNTDVLYRDQRRKGSITKSEGYVAKIFCAEYDLEEMLIAYGVKHVTEMIIALHQDLKEGRRYKNRDKAARRITERVAGA